MGIEVNRGCRAKGQVQWARRKTEGYKEGEKEEGIGTGRKRKGVKKYK